MSHMSVAPSNSVGQPGMVPVWSRTGWNSGQNHDPAPTMRGNRRGQSPVMLPSGRGRIGATGSGAGTVTRIQLVAGKSASPLPCDSWGIGNPVRLGAEPLTREATVTEPDPVAELIRAARALLQACADRGLDYLTEYARMLKALARHEQQQEQRPCPTT